MYIKWKEFLLKAYKKNKKKELNCVIIIILVSYYKKAYLAYLLFTENQDVHALTLKSSSYFTITSTFNLKNLCEETISRTDEGQPRPKYIFNKCGTNIYFFTLQRFGPSPSLNFKWY